MGSVIWFARIIWPQCFLRFFIGITIMIGAGLELTVMRPIIARKFSGESKRVVCIRCDYKQ